MAYKIIKDGGGESDPLVNKMMTTDEVKLLIRQILSESTDFEMEPVEVVSFNNDGSIRGRYVISEHDKKVSELNIFKPLNQNVIQYPVAGEVVIGVEFIGERYYFSDVNPLPARINSQQFNISNTSNSKNLNTSNFIDELRTRDELGEGDTIIQGRFNNSIKLSSAQPELNSPSISIRNDNTEIRMTNNQKVNYSLPTLKFSEIIDIDYIGPQINFDSDRIILNAKKNDIGIFAEGNVLIKGSRVDIENNNGGVNIK